MIPISLRLKSLAVGTALEAPAKHLRWVFGLKQRIRHPELWEIYLEERRLVSVLKKVLREDNACAVDVGCHIGSFLSLLFTLAPRGRHIAFEPSAAKSEILRRRFPLATIYSSAVSDRSGNAVFYEDSRRPGYSRLQQKGEAPARHKDSYEVETCRLDDHLIEAERLDLIKLDIEGGELAALRGATGVMQKFRPTIIFECGAEYGLPPSYRRQLFDFITTALNCDIYSFADFLFDKPPIGFNEFEKSGLYPFRAFNFVAVPRAKQI